MKGQYDAVVVGGGVAGLTSTAYLCRYGYRTLLCEKNNKTGGLVNTFQHQGYFFDGGIRAFENSGIVFPMLKNLGIEIEFAQNPVSIGIDKHWIRLHSRESLKDYASMLTDIFPEDAEDIIKIIDVIKKVMTYMDVLYGIDNPMFVENIKNHNYLIKTLLPWLIKYQFNIRKASALNEPVSDYLKGITNNQALIDMIIQHFFKATPTFFAMSYFGLYMDYCYPKGGTGVLAQRLTDYILSYGGEIITQTSVSSVDVDKRQIRAGENIYSYKKLVWAADQRTLYTSIGDHTVSRVNKQYSLAKKSSCGDSILALFIGVKLDKDYFQSKCGAHAFYTATSKGLTSLTAWQQHAANEEELYEWIGRYLELTTYEISCPALRDEALAPEGKTGVIVSTLMDYELVHHISESHSYDTFKKYCTKKILEVLEGTLFPGIVESIESSMCSTPLTIERETGSTGGAITGWAFTNTPMPSENRFRKITNAIKTPIEDVFQCGQWTFSPSGLPVSIFTGKLAADAVHKSLKGSGLLC